MLSVCIHIVYYPGGYKLVLFFDKKYSPSLPNCSNLFHYFTANGCIIFLISLERLHLHYLRYNNNNIEKNYTASVIYTMQNRLKIEAKATLGNVRRRQRYKSAPARRYISTIKEVTLLTFNKVEVEDMAQIHLKSKSEPCA
jgi:hypothetical protein